MTEKPRPLIEPLPSGCDRDCLQDWQREQDARRRGGWRA